MTFRPLIFIAALAGFAAHAQTPADLGDLVGARASSGETQVQARGYRFIRGSQVNGQSWTFWWSDIQRQCVSIATADGRYATISMIPAQNCVPAAVAQAEPVAAPVPPPLPPDAIVLVCYGEGSRPSAESHTGYQWNSRTHHYDPISRVESSTDHFHADLQIDIRGGEGRIHPTGKLVPPLNSGGSNGWWPLTDLRVGPETISARYRLNPVNHPNVVIDRRTGSIAIDGLGDFRGTCEGGNWGAGRRF